MTTSSTSPIYVNDRLFLGRVREQREFRNLLRDVLDERDGDALPYVVLLYGDGGIGKTTLAKRLLDIAAGESPFEGEFQSLWVDWEQERVRHIGLQVGRERVDAVTVFDVLHQAAIRQEWGRPFEPYRKARGQQAEAEQVAAQALGGELGEALAPVRGLSALAIARLVRMNAPVIGETGEAWVKAAADFGLKVSIEQGTRLYGALRQQLQARMKPELYQLSTWTPRSSWLAAWARGYEMSRDASGCCWCWTPTRSRTRPITGCGW